MHLISDCFPGTLSTGTNGNKTYVSTILQCQQEIKPNTLTLPSSVYFALPPLPPLPGGRPPFGAFHNITWLQFKFPPRNPTNKINIYCTKMPPDSCRITLGPSEWGGMESKWVRVWWGVTWTYRVWQPIHKYPLHTQLGSDSDPLHPLCGRQDVIKGWPLTFSHMHISVTGLATAVSVPLI